MIHTGTGIHMQRLSRIIIPDQRESVVHLREMNCDVDGCETRRFQLDNRNEPTIQLGIYAKPETNINLSVSRSQDDFYQASGISGSTSLASFSSDSCQPK